MKQPDLPKGNLYLRLQKADDSESHKLLTAIQKTFQSKGIPRKDWKTLGNVFVRFIWLIIENGSFAKSGDKRLMAMQQTADEIMGLVGHPPIIKFRVIETDDLDPDDFGLPPVGCDGWGE